MGNIKLSHTLKSYGMIFLVGIFVGCICRLLDYCPSGYWWSFTSMQTLPGFWLITNIIIVLLSTSNKCAGISSFLYMSGMTLSFYGLKSILEQSTSHFHEGFNTHLFLMFSFLSVLCGVAAFILFYWNKNNSFSSLLYSLPVGALAAETIAIIYYLLQHHTVTFLDQLIMDIGGIILFGITFLKKVKNRKIYIVGIMSSALIIFFLFPW